MSIKRVLLAEDDIDDQDIFRNFLEHRSDLNIMPIAENGEELRDMLELIKEDALLPDIVILDQNMPRCNGLQTLKMLKSTERYAHIPVFVYSTHADHRLRTECIAYGAFDIITKPISQQGYEEMIDLFVEKCASNKMGIS